MGDNSYIREGRKEWAMLTQFSVKNYKSIKDRITQSDKEIFNIQQQLKEIRGY